MVLAHSRRMVTRLVFDQKASTWLLLHIEAFLELGGVPRVIVPDNLKAAVIRAAFRPDDESQLNKSYRELARHYGFKVDPTPPFSPEKKGKVESGVKYVKRNFLVGRSFVDLVDVGEQWHEWNATVADVRVHGTTHQPPLARFAEEQALLMPRAARPGYRLEARYPRIVAEDFLVSLDTNRYSVPFTLIGHTVDVERRDGQVRIHHRGRLVATHTELPGRHGLVVVPEHGPGPAARNARLRRATPSAASPSLTTEAIAVEQRDLTLYDELLLAGGAR
jgi:hypothetical protein